MYLGLGPLRGDYGLESKALINGIIDLIKQSPERSPAPSAIWKHSKKMAVYEPGSRSSPDTKSAGTLI